MSFTKPENSPLALSTEETEVPEWRHHNQRSHHSQLSAPPTVYCTPTKTPLSRQALRELDHSTKQCPPPLQPLPRELSYDEVDLERVASLGGPDLGHVRNYPDPCIVVASRQGGRSAQSRVSNENTSSKSQSGTSGLSAYGHLFERTLQDHGVYSRRQDQNPANLKQIKKRLRQRRGSLSSGRFEAQDFRAFQDSTEYSDTESRLMTAAFPILIGKSDITSQQNVQFNNLAPLFSAGLCNPKPDFFDGCLATDLKKSIRDELSDYIDPSRNSSTILPNFFIETRGARGDDHVSKLQACYDAAIGARAIHALRQYTDPDTAIDGKAYTISATLRGGHGSNAVLTLYAMHPVVSKDPDRPLDYHMTMLRGWHLTSDISSFRRGAAAIRNAREWAEEQRTSLIAAANVKALASGMAQSAAHQPIVNTKETDSTANELASDHDPYRVNPRQSVSSVPRGQIPLTAPSSKMKRKRGDDED